MSRYEFEPKNWESNLCSRVQNYDVREMPLTRHTKRTKFHGRRSFCPLEFEVYPELHELIFQHFDEADVLISSETNRKWFDAIGGSKICMKKINLVLDNWWQNETPESIAKVMKIIQKTTRKYQNVQINANDDVEVSKRAIQLLKKLAPTIVDLKFLNTDGVQLNESFKLPKLEKLQFINNICNIDDLLLSSSIELRELNLKHHYWANPVPVISCLKLNTKLEMLKLWDMGIAKMFVDYEPNDFKFKLKRFATGADGNISIETENRFLQFLETQSDSMEAIRFRSGLDGINSRVINKVFEMSAMKIVHVDGIVDLGELKLPINLKLIELRLPWAVDSLAKLSPFLRAAPKLKVLFLRKINKDILEYIANHMAELKLLYYTRAEGCMGCFKKFLSANKDANKHIQLVSKEWY